MAAGSKVNGSLWSRLTKKRRKRRRNPDKLQRAKDFYRDFHWGDEPDGVAVAEFPDPPKAATKLGTLHAVTYETTKDGETALWEHEFGEEGGEKPDLVVDPSNHQLHIVGGDYTVEPRGIVD